MIEILHNDNDVIVCIKPSGTISELNPSSPISLPAILLKEANVHEIYCVHRLDKEVGGVMVYAKNAKAAATLTKQITDGAFKKEYLAEIHGKPDEDEANLIDLLYHDKNKNKTYVVDRERRGVKRAELNYKLIKSKDTSSIISINLITGRTHQIRVQFASRKHPILGDKKYGSDSDIKPMRLHCTSISFLSPSNKDTLSFSSYPEWHKKG